MREDDDFIPVCRICDKELGMLYVTDNEVLCADCLADEYDRLKQTDRTDYINKLETQNDKYETALHTIADWAKAYPLEVFPEPDMKKVRNLLAAGGIPIDFVSASNMRHVVKSVAKLAQDALDMEAKE